MRRLDAEFVDEILKELEEQKKIEFKDHQKDAFLVFRVSPDQIAHAIDAWVGFWVIRRKNM